MNDRILISDEELLVLIQQGNHTAFKMVFDRYWGIAYDHAMRLMQNEEEAKDIVQEVFLQIWQKSSQFEIRSSFSSLLFIAIRNRVLNAIRNKRVRADYIELFSLYIEAQTENVQSKLVEKETETAISQAVAQLPEKMRAVFELSRKEHLSNKEIASRLSISEKTVKKQISNALAALRVKLGMLTAYLLSASVITVSLLLK